jgi:hypothetical protein
MRTASVSPHTRRRKVESTLQSRAVARAAEILGGVEELASSIGLATGTVRMMIAGKLPVPQQVFLQVVDIISADDAPQRGS